MGPATEFGVTSIAKLGRWNRKKFRELTGPVLVTAPRMGRPVAVVIPYGQFVEMQQTIVRAIQEISTMEIPKVLANGIPPLPQAGKGEQ